jgi:dephospho-CoA kinase
MVIGITGNFGAGKTAVADVFRRLGARIIDADRIAHTIMKPRTPAYKEIVTVFGRRVLVGSYISRRRLAEMVFSDKKKLKKLNKITHPRILRMIKSRIKKLSDNEILVIDAPLLIESGLLPWVDRLIVVKCNLKIQMQRLKKSGLTANQIRTRLSFQLPQGEKIRFADFVIDNSSRRSRTEKQVREIWNRIKKGGGKWKR